MDGQLQNIRSELGGFFGDSTSGPTTGHTEGTITGGSFAYDEDALRDLVTSWLNLAQNYQTSVADVHDMRSVSGPGLDFASEAQANAANASGDAYRDHLHLSLQYCVDQAQRCQDTLDDYLGVEHHNVKDILSSGPQEGI